MLIVYISQIIPKKYFSQATHDGHIFVKKINEASPSTEIDPSLNKENMSPDDNANEIPLEQREVIQTVSSVNAQSAQTPPSTTAPIVSDSSWKCGGTTQTEVCIIMCTYVLFIHIYNMTIFLSVECKCSNHIRFY